MSVSTIRNNAPALAALLEKAAMGAVKASCEAMKDDCENTVRVRTGALRGGFYTSADGHSEYGEAAADAQAHNPKVVIVPEVKPETPTEGILSNVGLHNIWNELGGPTISPLPAMHQAADQEKAKLPERIAAAIAAVTK